MTDQPLDGRQVAPGGSSSPAAVISMAGPLKGQLTLTGYVLPDGLSYEEWAHEGTVLVTIAKASAWWVGDWLLYGEHQFGEKYAQAVEVTGLSVQTLKNAQWVSDRIPPRERDPEIPHSYYRAAAALDPKDRRVLLKRAKNEGMNEGEVRARAQHIKAGGDAKEDPPPPEKHLPPPTLGEIVEDVIRRLAKAEIDQSWEHVEQCRMALEDAIGIRV